MKIQSLILLLFSPSIALKSEPPTFINQTTSEIRAIQPNLVKPGDGRVSAVSTNTLVLVSGYVILDKTVGSRRLKITYKSEYLSSPVSFSIPANAGQVISLPAGSIKNGRLSSCLELTASNGQSLPSSGDPVPISVTVEDAGLIETTDSDRLTNQIRSRRYVRGFPTNSDQPDNQGRTVFVLDKKRRIPILVNLVSSETLSQRGVWINVPTNETGFSIDGRWDKAEVFFRHGYPEPESC
jgi:hypothetical protein